MITISATLRILLVSTLLAVAACGADKAPSPLIPEGGKERQMSRIEGEVFYRERMMLPPGAELEVQLQDISRADAMATVIATVMQQLQSAPPYPFAIEYDPDSIDPRMRYALRAIISMGDRLLFTSTEYIDPFTGGSIEIMVQRVAEPVDKAAAVEQAASPESGIASTPARSRSSDDEVSAPAVWELVTLAGEPAPTGADGNPVQLSMNSEDSTAAGFSGCNRYSGKFSSEGSSADGTPIKFGPLAGTMRFCAEGDELERAYLKMLDSVDAYRMRGEGLELMQGDRVVSTFKQRR